MPNSEATTSTTDDRRTSAAYEGSTSSSSGPGTNGSIGGHPESRSCRTTSCSCFAESAAPAAYLSCLAHYGESCMKNGMQQFCTFGSVRERAAVAMVTLNGHTAGNGGHGQGD